MNRTAGDDSVYTDYLRDVETFQKRKSKEEDLIKKFSNVNPDAFDRTNKGFETDIAKFKQSSEVMLSQLEEYEKKKKALMLKNKGRNF